VVKKGEGGESLAGTRKGGKIKTTPPLPLSFAYEKDPRELKLNVEEDSGIS